DKEVKGTRPSRCLPAPHRISVRSRRGALRYRHRLQTVRGKRRHAPVASRVVEWLKDVNGSPGGSGKQPGESAGCLANIQGAIAWLEAPSSQHTMKRIAIIGGGISGLSAAYTIDEKRRSGTPVQYVLF